MAIRRTLKHKQRAAVHRQTEMSYSYQGSEATPPEAKSESAVSQPIPISQAEPSLILKLFGYSPHLVYNDLLKTVVVTLIVVGILIFLYTQMR